MKKCNIFLPGRPSPIGGFQFLYYLSQVLSSEISVNVFHVNMDKSIIGKVKFNYLNYTNKWKNYAETNWNIKTQYASLNDLVKSRSDINIIASWQLLNYFCSNSKLKTKSTNTIHIAMDYPGFMGPEGDILKSWMEPITYVAISRHLHQEINKVKLNEANLYYFPAVIHRDFVNTQGKKDIDILVNLTDGKYKNYEYGCSLVNRLSSKYKIACFGRHLPKIDLNKKIEFFHMPSDAQVGDLYLRSRSVLSVSHYEGFGIPTFEGLRHGLIIFTTDSYGCRDYLDFKNVGVKLCGNEILTDFDVVDSTLSSLQYDNQLCSKYENIFNNFLNSHNQDNLKKIILND